jgi:hypothetical protein
MLHKLLSCAMLTLQQPSLFEWNLTQWMEETSIIIYKEAMLQYFTKIAVKSN